MIAWNMTIPKKLISGRGTITYLPKLLEEMGLRRPFIVVDPIVKETDFGKKCLKLLDYYAEELFSDFGTNPTFLQANEGIKRFNGKRYDCIIAIGGGSAIDLAKIVGLVAANGGEAEEYFQGRKAGIEPVPTSAVPTTCGTGAESSPFAVIMDPSAPKKRGIESIFLMPTAVILDADSLLSLRPVMIAATGMDAFSHILESHISRKATSLTRIVSKGLLCSIREPIEIGITERNISALETLHSVAFTARLLYPRTGLSIAHALSHPLGAFTNMHHGLAVVTFLEASMAFNLPACSDSLREAAEMMGFSVETIKNHSLLSWISSIVQESGMGEAIFNHLISFTDLPIEKIASEALQSSNIPSNPKEIGFEETCEIVRNSLARFGK